MNPSETVVLEEYKEATVRLSHLQERSLRHLAGNRLAIFPGEEVDSYVIRATSYVGTLVSPGVRIIIRPKVSTANLFHLLEAGGRALATGPEIFDYEISSDLLPAFATFYARHLEACVGRGIARSYLDWEDSIFAVRGRVNLRGQQRRGGLPLPVDCLFDEYTANTPLNRIIVSAAIRLARLPTVTGSSRQALLQMIGRFEGVQPVTTGDLAQVTKFTRLTDHYRTVERLARLVLNGSSLLDAAGATGAAVFLVDMNKVFEEFIEARLRRYLAGRLIVEGQRPSKLDVTGYVGIKPDLVFRRSSKPIGYVADTKYKITTDGLGRESDYYQLLAYTTALSLDEGLLIYCQHDGSLPPKQIVVRNAEKRLLSMALRLDGSIADLESEVKGLADYIEARIRDSAAVLG